MTVFEERALKRLQGQNELLAWALIQSMSLKEESLYTEVHELKGTMCKEQQEGSHQ